MEFLIAACVFMAVTAGIYAVFQMRAAGTLAAQARIERFSGIAPAFDLQASAVALRGSRMSSIPWVERLLTGKGFANSLDLLMIRAGWRMRVGEFIGTCFIVGAAVFFVATIVLNQPLIAIAPGLAGSLIPFFYLKHSAKKRVAKIEKQLAETLVLMANALRAGFGLMQAVGQAVRQVDAPIRDELAQLVRDTQIGSSIDDAVTELGRRVGSYDLDIVVTAVLVQRNVGGNLADILDGVAHTIRERERIRGEIRTLIAEQKMTGIVIAIVPPAVGVLFFMLNREYMMTLFTNPTGKLLLGLAVGLELMGGWMIRRIVNIDV